MDWWCAGVRKLQRSATSVERGPRRKIKLQRSGIDGAETHAAPLELASRQGRMRSTNIPLGWSFRPVSGLVGGNPPVTVR